MKQATLTAIIHFQTPDLLEQAVTSFREHCPGAPLLIVDNGSTDGSADTVRQLGMHIPGVLTRMLTQNCFHGPAMDLVLQEADADTVFFLDSDTVTRRGGFLEPMREMVLRPATLASGQVALVDRRGFAAPRGIPVPVSAYMAINTEAYRKLPPFRHHGLPVLQTCKAAQDKGLAIRPFPVEEYVDHLGRGTAERYGYGLGWKSRISYLMHRLGF